MGNINKYGSFPEEWMKNKGSRGQGFQGSSEVLKHYETQLLLAGDLCYIRAEKLKKIKDDIGEVEQMFKALIKSLENKHLNP